MLFSGAAVEPIALSGREGQTARTLKPRRRTVYSYTVAQFGF